MDMTMFEWPTKAKVESTDYVAICDADGNEKKIAVDELKNIQKEETAGETAEEWLKAKLKSYAEFSDGFYPDLGGWSGGTDVFGLATKKGTTVQYVGFMADGKIRMGSYNTQNEAYKIYMHSDDLDYDPTQKTYYENDWQFIYRYISKNQVYVVLEKTNRGATEAQSRVKILSSCPLKTLFSQEIPVRLSVSNTIVGYGVMSFSGNAVYLSSASYNSDVTWHGYGIITVG